MATITRKTIHLLYSSGEPDELTRLNDIVAGHPEVKVSFVRQGPLLVGWEELPFLDTIEGDHIVGIDAIRNFVEQSKDFR